MRVVTLGRFVGVVLFVGADHVIELAMRMNKRSFIKGGGSVGIAHYGRLVLRGQKRFFQSGVAAKSADFDEVELDLCSTSREAGSDHEEGG